MTTPLRPVDKVTFAAANLKAAAPNRFSEFMEALHELVAQRNAECVQAPPDGVLRAQGRALQLQDIESTLKTCSEEAQKLYAKLQQKEKT